MVHAEKATTIRMDNVAEGGKPQRFEYDYAIEPEASQESVFDRIGVSIVQDAFNGYNSTVRCGANLFSQPWVLILAATSPPPHCRCLPTARRRAASHSP